MDKEETLISVSSLVVAFLSLPPDKILIAIIIIMAIIIYWNYSKTKNSFH